MQSIPHTEEASSAVNGEGERKKQNGCRAADHFERPRVQLYKICSANGRAASLIGEREKPLK